MGWSARVKTRTRAGSSCSSKIRLSRNEKGSLKGLMLFKNLLQILPEVILDKDAVARSSATPISKLKLSLGRRDTRDPCFLFNNMETVWRHSKRRRVVSCQKWRKSASESAEARMASPSSCGERSLTNVVSSFFRKISHILSRGHYKSEWEHGVFSHEELSQGFVSTFGAR